MPPKRQRGGAGAGAITMRHHPIAEGDVGPLIVGFQQGPPLEGALLGGGAGAGSDNPLVFEYMRSSNPRRTQRKLYARSDLAKYEASTKGASAVDYKYAVGIYSQERGVLDVYEAEAGGQVFALELVDVTRNASAIAPVDAAAVVLTNEQLRARRDDLIAEFGSRKKKKMEATRKANIIDKDAVLAPESVADALRVGSANNGIATVAAAAASAAAADGVGSGAVLGTSAAAIAAGSADARSRLLPPHDAHASSVEEAYPIDGLVSPTLAEALGPRVNALIKVCKDAAALHELIGAAAPHQEYVREGIARVLTRATPTAAGAGAGAGAGATGEAAAAGGAGVFKKSIARMKLRCLLLLRDLLILHACDPVIRPRLPKPPRGAGGDGMEGAGAGAMEMTSGDAHPTQPLIIHSHLSDTHPRVIAFMLSTFAHARFRTTGMPADGTVATSSEEGASADYTYHRSKEGIDKLRCHIAALALVVEDYQLDLGTLARALHITPVALLHYFRELGCVSTPVRATAAAAAAAAAKSAAAAAAGGGGEEEEDDEMGPTASARGVVSYVVTLRVPLVFPRLKIQKGR